MNNTFIQKDIKIVLDSYQKEYEEELSNNSTSEEELEKIVNDILKDFNDELEKDHGLPESYLNRLENRIYKTKSRWVKQEIENQSSAHNQSIDMAKKIYNEKIFSREDFVKSYKASDTEELRRNTEEELANWRRNKKEPLITFKYLQQRKKYQTITAVKNDIEKLMIEYVIEKAKIKKREIFGLPDSLGNVSVSPAHQKIDTTSPINKVVDGIPGEYYQHLYVVDENTKFETLIGSDLVTENAMSEILVTTMASVLDSFDFNILLFVLSRKHSNFYADREVVFPLSELVQYINPDKSKNPGKFYYQKARGSLLKMSNIRVTVLDQGTLGVSMGIFNLVKLTQKDENSPIMARVEVSAPIVDDLLRKRTINIYKDSYSKLEESISKVLVFKLQAQRLSFLSEDSENNELKLPLTFFKSACMLSSKREDRNMARIEKGLDELQESKIVIKSYRRVGHDYFIKFINLTNEEKRDLLSNKKNDLKLIK